MAWLPDFDSLERYVHSVAENPDPNRYDVVPETYTEHQARMATVGFNDPRWDEHFSRDHKLIRKDGKPWNWLNGDHRHIQAINRINEKRRIVNSRVKLGEENFANINYLFDGADIQYHRKINSNYESDSNVVFIDCTFSKHVKIAAENITIIGNNDSGPRFIEANGDVVIFGHHFISSVECQHLIGIGYDFRVDVNALEENWISSKDDWIYAENLLETYAECLNRMLHDYRIYDVEIPTAQQIMATARKRQIRDSSTIRVNGRDYGDSQGNLVKDISSAIINAMFKNGKNSSKNNGKGNVNNSGNNQPGKSTI